jgi:hypothetical protein
MQYTAHRPIAYHAYATEQKCCIGIFKKKMLYWRAASSWALGFVPFEQLLGRGDPQTRLAIYIDGTLTVCTCGPERIIVDRSRM